MKSKELKVYNIPGDSFPEVTIDAKPRSLFLLVILIGTIMMVLGSTVEAIVIVGVAMTFLALTPRVILLEFYHDYLIAYNKADKSVCKLVYYDEVVSWNYVKGKRDYLYIELEDQDIVTVEGFSKHLFEAYMSKYMMNKKVKK